MPMTPYQAIDLGRDAIVTALLMGSPVLVIGMLVGLAIGLIQALTQIQDQTLAFVPKIAAMVLALSIFLPWIIQLMVEYCEDLIANIPRMIGAG
jgi:flagellar biosynthetic protein FliQ